MPKRKSIDADSDQVGIRKRDVPVYLRSGALYQSLADGDDEEVIMVPRGAVKSNNKVKSLSQANHLFESLRFWIVEDIPVSFVNFVFTEPKAILPDTEFWNKFSSEFPWLKYMKKCANPNIKRDITKMEHILPSDNMELVKVAHDLLQCMPTHACAYAVCTGSIENLKFIHSLCNFKPSNQSVCCLAISHCEDETLLAAAHELGYSLGGCHSTSTAARLGKLSCLKYLHEHGCRWNSETTRYAVQNNFPECLKYALKHGCPRDRYICCDAAEHGYLQCLQYAHENGCDWDEQACIGAAQNGHLSCLQYAHQVARMGTLPCLQYLHEQGAPWSEGTYAAAAYRGRLDFLQYMHTLGLEWDETISAAAAGGGFLQCLEYLHNHGCPWDASACAAATRCGRLHCLQYLHEQGCPWDASTLAEAASSDNMSCLQYLHEQGCPWDVNVCTAAARAGHVQCLQYLYEHGCPWDASAYTAAARWGLLRCLQYLHEQGCPWDATTCRAAADDRHLACLEYAHTHGCSIDSDTVEAAKRGYSQWHVCFRYILQHCAPEALQTLEDAAAIKSEKDSDLEDSDMGD